jgi:hypothetical protein
MTERSRIRYERNRRQRVRVLPSGMADLFTQTQRDRANREAAGPAVRVPFEVPKSVDLNCPRCGHRFSLGRVHDDGVEFRGSCGGCMRKFIYMKFSSRTCVLTIKEVK